MTQEAYRIQGGTVNITSCLHPNIVVKFFYGEKRRAVGEILRKLCEWKGVKIIEAECCPDHIHMLLEIPPKM